MSDAAIQEYKTRLRKSLLQHRSALDPAARAAGNRAILDALTSLEEIDTARTVFCYISQGHEADTRNLLDWLVQQGKQVYVPRVIGGRQLQAVAFPGWDGLAPGPLGILSPAGGKEVTRGMDVCITPGIGFSADGGRLGHGAGYYDRWFAVHEAACKIAPLYDYQLCDAIPVESHDIAMDILITETRTIRVKNIRQD